MGARTIKTGQARWFVGYKKHSLRFWWRDYEPAVLLVPLVSWVTPANVYEGDLLVPSVHANSLTAPAVHETLLGLLPLNTLPAQQLLQQVRHWIEPAQAYEKNQLGLSQMFLNSLRLTWCMALLADAVVLLRYRALLHAPPHERAILTGLAAQQGEFKFST